MTAAIVILVIILLVISFARDGIRSIHHGHIYHFTDDGSLIGEDGIGRAKRAVLEKIAKEDQKRWIGEVRYNSYISEHPEFDPAKGYEPPVTPYGLTPYFPMGKRFGMDVPHHTNRNE